jgi:hypothetical protein
MGEHFSFFLSLILLKMSDLMASEAEHLKKGLNYSIHSNRIISSFLSHFENFSVKSYLEQLSAISFTYWIAGSSVKNDRSYLLGTPMKFITNCI